MKTKYILLISLVGILFACTKLDEVTYDKINGDKFPESEAQVAGLSVTAYTPLRPLIDDEGWWFLAQEISSDELCGPTRGADWFDGGKWQQMHRHTWSNDNEGVNQMWDKFYTGVTTCNQVLDIMRKITPSVAITKKMKEVEVLRSFYYYLLIDNYGDVPYLTTTIDVPLKPYKVKREVIYDSLINTITSALPYLKAIDNKYMVTKYMAYSLLTKLYINSEVYTGTPHWQLAKDLCDSIIAGPYNFESNFLAPFFNHE